MAKFKNKLAYILALVIPGMSTYSYTQEDPSSANNAEEASSEASGSLSAGAIAAAVAAAAAIAALGDILRSPQ